jgi:hypothetical protein
MLASVARLDMDRVIVFFAGVRWRRIVDVSGEAVLVFRMIVIGVGVGMQRGGLS